jgi:RNA polymerase-binding transcription factor DksA
MIKKLVNKLFLMKQKSFLLKEKQRLGKELDLIRKFPQFGDTDEDNAQEVETFEGYKGLEKGMDSLLKEVNRALNKLEKGTYGICEVCKKTIETGRLQAFPAARTCVECVNKKK